MKRLKHETRLQHLEEDMMFCKCLLGTFYLWFCMLEERKRFKPKRK